MVQAPGEEVTELRSARDVGDGEAAQAPHGSKQLTAGPEVQVEFDPDAHRFEATVPGHPEVAFLDVIKATTVWTFSHTEVPASMEGRGVGSKLVKAALDHVRGLGVMVIPSCPFVAAYIRRHPEEVDLVPDRYRYLVDREGE